MLFNALGYNLRTTMQLIYTKENFETREILYFKYKWYKSSKIRIQII